MMQEQHSTIDASGIVSPAMNIRIPCMAHVIQFALSAFLSSFRVDGHTKSWNVQERKQHFGKNACMDTGNSQRLRKNGNARITKMSDMRLRWAKIIRNVRFSGHLQSPETDIHIAENTCCIDYTNIWLLKSVHWMFKRQSMNHSTTNYGCEIIVELHCKGIRPCMAS